MKCVLMTSEVDFAYLEDELTTFYISQLKLQGLLDNHLL